MIFKRATRGPSISSTRNSCVPTVNVSPAFGKPSSFCVSQPLTVATLSSCCTSPMILSKSCNGSVPAASQHVSPKRASSISPNQTRPESGRRVLQARPPASRCRPFRRIRPRRRRSAIFVRETVAAIFPAARFRERKSICAPPAANPPPYFALSRSAYKSLM